MFFPTAGIEVSLWIPPLVAFVISFFTSMGGVSGAFLLLPFQMSFLGYTHPSVSATNQVFNLLAIPSGVYRYRKERRMVWPLTWIIIAGTMPGVFIGAIVRITLLPSPNQFKLFAAVVLLYIGLKIVRELLGAANANHGGVETKFHKAVRRAPLENRQAGEVDAGSLPRVKVLQFNLKHLRYTFYDETFEIPSWSVFLLSFVVGIVGGIYGIGGGSIIAPFFVTFFRLPVYTVAGAALMGTFITSLSGVAVFEIIAPLYPDMSVAPDWMLGLLFGLGGMAGMYLGACCQKFVPAKVIKWMLAGIIIFTGLKYLFSFF